MNGNMKQARRYHWHSAAVRDFTDAPHSAIVGEHAGVIQNLVDHEAGPARDALLAIVREPPDRILGDVRHLVAPAHHDVRAKCNRGMYTAVVDNLDLGECPFELSNSLLEDRELRLGILISGAVP